MFDFDFLKRIDEALKAKRLYICEMTWDYGLEVRLYITPYENRWPWSETDEEDLPGLEITFEKSRDPNKLLPFMIRREEPVYWKTQEAFEEGLVEEIVKLYADKKERLARYKANGEYST